MCTSTGLCIEKSLNFINIRRHRVYMYFIMTIGGRAAIMAYLMAQCHILICFFFFKNKFNKSCSKIYHSFVQGWSWLKTPAVDDIKDVLMIFFMIPWSEYLWMESFIKFIQSVKKYTLKVKTT